VDGSLGVDQHVVPLLIVPFCISDVDEKVDASFANFARTSNPMAVECFAGADISVERKIWSHVVNENDIQSKYLLCLRGSGNISCAQFIDGTKTELYTERCHHIMLGMKWSSIHLVLDLTFSVKLIMLQSH
jgi:hypothetical protein